ncbi:c-type cytochrome [Lignipirellula cremea]|uniref:c-type cytochrome n=1 Tax=Lignipirellula cremea TaxID=2528010 RepID=UPI0018D26F0B|nr:c-type cytochrome [Lignipirellula cremea]
MKRVSPCLKSTVCWVLFLLLFTAPAVRAEEDSGLDSLVELLAVIEDPSFQLDLLKGMHDALEGRLNVPPPKGWSDAYGSLSKSPNNDVRVQARELALIFGDKVARGELTAVIADPKRTAEERAAAIKVLVQTKTPDLEPLLFTLLDQPAVCGPALRALGASSHADTPAQILKRYSKFSVEEKRDAMTTLCSRPVYARQLLDALEANQIPPVDVSAFHVRQLQSLGDAELDARVAKTWGVSRPTSAEIAQQIARLKKQYNADRIAAADLPQGRLLFTQTCAACHTLYGEGGKIGPDITGSNRNNLDYLFENILDPSAAVAKAYQVTSIITDDGRVISGIIGRTNGGVLEVQTVNEKLLLDQDSIEEMRPSAKSMMPDGLVEKLTPEDLLNLVAYLSAMKQVALPPGAELPPAAGVAP